MGFNWSRYSITCCKDCPDRYPGCHSKCDKYIKARAEYDAVLNEHRKHLDVSLALTQQRCDVIHKATKRRRYKDKYR